MQFEPDRPGMEVVGLLTTALIRSRRPRGASGPKRAAKMTQAVIAPPDELTRARQENLLLHSLADPIIERARRRVELEDNFRDCP